MKLKNFPLFYVAIFLNVIISANVWAMPTAGNNDESVTYNDEVTPYPYTQRKFVDLNYVSPEISNIIQRSNLNVEQIRQQQARLRTRNEVITSSTSQAPIDSQNDEEEYRLARIQSELEATLRDPQKDQEDGRETERRNAKTQASFEYAFPAVCEMPKYMNITEWFGQKSWNIIFKPIYRRFNIQSSVLRIYKIKKDENKSSNQDDCSENTDSFYNLSVSVYTRKKNQNKSNQKDFTKKVIHTSMIPSKRVGWIEIDAMATLKYWNNAKNNFGIAIDIYNEKNNEQLDAREFFELQNCDDEAASPIPWGAFEFIARSRSQDQDVPSSVLEQHREMFPQPRLDIISSHPAYYDSDFESGEDENERLRRNNKNKRRLRHVRHENHHFHHSSLNDHHVSIDNLVSILKNKSHKRRGHINQDVTAGDT